MHKILVVDDEPLVRMVAVCEFEDSGYAVLEAGSAKEALSMLGEAPDLIVTDVNMPHMTGWEFAAHVRTLHPAMPIIYVSGYPCPEGAMDERSACLVKPYRADKLMEAAQKLLGQLA